MSNALDAFAEEGLNPGELIFDGKIHRFSVSSDDKKKSGWYVAHQNYATKSGEEFEVIVFGNLRKQEKYTYQTDKVTLTREDKKNIRDYIEKAKKSEEEARNKLQQEISVDVEDKWKSLSEKGTSSYLERKQLSEANLGIRFDSDWFYVPMSDIHGKNGHFKK